MTSATPPSSRSSVTPYASGAVVRKFASRQALVSVNASFNTAPGKLKGREWKQTKFSHDVP
jgi:hypothetical protein